jgi:hypothetical protein
MIENAHKTIENARERSGTLKNGERSRTVNGQERLGTIESERSNALERIVENGHGTVTVRSRDGHGTVTFTLQKRKKHCRFIVLNVKKQIIFHFLHSVLVLNSIKTSEKKLPTIFLKLVPVLNTSFRSTKIKKLGSCSWYNPCRNLY